MTPRAALDPRRPAGHRRSPLHARHAVLAHIPRSRACPIPAAAATRRAVTVEHVVRRHARRSRSRGGEEGARDRPDGGTIVVRARRGAWRESPPRLRPEPARWRCQPCIPPPLDRSTTVALSTSARTWRRARAEGIPSGFVRHVAACDGPYAPWNVFLEGPAFHVKRAPSSREPAGEPDRTAGPMQRTCVAQSSARPTVPPPPGASAAHDRPPLHVPVPRSAHSDDGEPTHS